MRTRFVGWVAQFAGWWFLHHSGKDGYMLTQVLEEATRFGDLEEGIKHTRQIPQFILDKHGLPEVMPMWEKSQLSLMNPATGEADAGN